MDSWTSKDALYRDLARAQGGAPIAITDPLLYNESPRREYDEEKEMEYQFRDANATTDFSEGPDLQMIMHMLEMVNDYDVTPESDTVRISKLNPLCKDFIPKSSDDASCILEQKNTTKRKNRNAAIESIIKAKEESSNQSETSKYIPPHRNKLKTEEVKENESTQKKQNGLKPIVYNSNMASSMFKKKTVSKKSHISPDRIKVSPEILKTNTFVPSKVASSYYEKFVEFNEAKEEKRNDIWTVIQKKMTEYEERKHQETELTTSSDTEKSGEVSSPPLVQESCNEEQGR